MRKHTKGNTALFQNATFFNTETASDLSSYSHIKMLRKMRKTMKKLQQDSSNTSPHLFELALFEENSDFDNKSIAIKSLSPDDHQDDLSDSACATNKVQYFYGDHSVSEKSAFTSPNKNKTFPYSPSRRYSLTSVSFSTTNSKEPENFLPLNDTAEGQHSSVRNNHAHLSASKNFLQEQPSISKSWNCPAQSTSSSFPSTLCYSNEKRLTDELHERNISSSQAHNYTVSPLRGRSLISAGICLERRSLSADSVTIDHPTEKIAIDDSVLYRNGKVFNLNSDFSFGHANGSSWTGKPSSTPKIHLDIPLSDMQSEYNREFLW